MGNNYSREGHMLDSRMIELIKNHLELEISQNINDFENVDCMVYNESSADGYDLWVVTNDPRNVSVCEDVHYYANDLANAFEEQVRWGDRTFYIDEYVFEEAYIEDKLRYFQAECSIVPEGSYKKWHKSPKTDY